MSVKRKIIVYSLVIIIIGAIGFLYAKEPSILFTDATNHAPPKTVIIDAGHGGLTNTID